MPDKLKDAVKQIDESTKQLQKEKREWKVAQAILRRENVSLEAKKEALSADVTVLQAKKEELSGDIEVLRLNKQNLETTNTELEVSNGKIEADIASNTTELSALQAELTEKKASLDTDLEEYAAKRKQEIKDSILKANEELLTIQDEIKQRSSEIESKKTELGELNQIYLDEQEDIKVSNAETERVLAENRKKVTETQAEIDTLTDELKELEFKHNNVMISMTKAREEHDKFIEYEKKARKILDTKDQELQQRAADMATESQFLNNRRSNLPEL